MQFNELFRGDIKGMKFEDIVEFCELKEPENVQLDYKMEVTKNLKKHFAAFSNKRGGVIIVGVKEDKKSGVPEEFEGINEDAQIIEKIYQLAQEVNPQPLIETQSTTKKDGKYFIVIRIQEGPETPYYVNNDSNVYVRIGNTSAKYDEHYDIATPTELRLLFNKRESAREYRDIAIAEMDKHLMNKIESWKKVRLNKMLQEGQGAVSETKIGENKGLFDFLIQPFNPNVEIISAYNIHEEVKKNAVNVDHRETPNYPNLTNAPIQNGYTYSNMDLGSGSFEFVGIMSNGLIRVMDDVSGREQVTYIHWIASKIYSSLIFARNMYNSCGYKGSLIGELRISGMNDVGVRSFDYRNIFSEEFTRLSIRDEYVFRMESDTIQLNEECTFDEIIFELYKELHWSFGFEIAHRESSIKKFIEDLKSRTR